MNSPFTAFWVLLKRDIKLSFRRLGEMINPLIFFAILVTLFPLATSPEPETLATVAPGVLWVAALLATLLALESLFKDDFQDGVLEQLCLAPQSLSMIVLAKVVAHWLVTGLPLILFAPVAAHVLYLPDEAVGTLLLALALGTPTLSLLGGVGAALTVGLHRGGVLLSLLVLPLMIPVLIFGARVTDLAAQGEITRGPIYLLAAGLFMSLALVPVAMSAAVRISVD
ncbi:MAG: heme exporter protein CcmB [Pseudomonadota bacterium]